MNYSAVIPTYKRGNDLRRCVINLLNQTLKPSEIIISGVEGDVETYEAFESLKESYPDSNIKLVTLPRQRRGISAQRNNGLRSASFDLVLMVDDDVKLPPDFAGDGFRILLEQDALIVTGVEEGQKEPPKIQNAIRRIFYFDHYEKNKQAVLPSGAKVIAYQPASDLRAEFLGSQVWLMRKEIIDHFRFDETMITYSHREDQDFSYAVYRKFGPRLVMSPRLKFKHLHSPGGRVRQGVMSHIVVYNLLLNYRKHFFDRKNAKLIFTWCLLGLILQNLHQVIKRGNVTIFIETLNAVIGVINSWNHIRIGKFSKLYEKLIR